ncbi:MAG: hypothetical protein LBQ27_06425, partial [Clostridiales bacterium]|nr:hypothetical protein [Clostridiales bacterium]
MKKIYVAGIIAAICLLGLSSCKTVDSKDAITAISAFGDIVIYDDISELPRLGVIRASGAADVADYSEFWFSASYVFVQNGKLRVKNGAPYDFTDVLTITLKDDATVKQTLKITKPSIPLESVSIFIKNGKAYCIAGESLPLEVAFFPQNASNKNISLVTNFENASIENGVLFLSENFPDGQGIIITARIDDRVYGTIAVASKRRIEIFDAASLASVSENPAGDYALTADIDDFSGVVGAFPIPDFSGTFRGNGHVISNLSLYVSADTQTGEQNYGLFGVLTGEAFDFSLENFRIECGDTQGGSKYNIGLLAGKMSDAKISRVSVSGKIIFSRHLSRCGGVVGIAINSILDEVAAKDTVIEFTGGAEAAIEPTIGVFAGELSSSKILWMSVENGADGSKIDIGENQYLYVGNGLNGCYGKKDKKSIILTDRTEVSIHVYEGDSIK